jgi:hypothetical protein
MTCWRRRHEPHAYGRPAFALGALSNLFPSSPVRFSALTLPPLTLLCWQLRCRAVVSLLRLRTAVSASSAIPSAKERPIGAMKVPAKATVLQSAPRARLLLPPSPHLCMSPGLLARLTLREIGKALCTMMACVFLSGLIRFQSRIKQEMGSSVSRRAHHSALAMLLLFKHTYTHPPNPYPLHPNVTRIAARSARTPSSPFDSVFFSFIHALYFLSRPTTLLKL